MKREFNADNLTRFGLTESEVKVYISLLERRTSTATEVVKMTGVPRSKIYEILNRLIQKGMCVEVLDSVKKYSATSPKTAFEGLNRQFSQEYFQELESRKVLADNLAESLSKIYTNNNDNSNRLDQIRILRERNVIRETFLNLEKEAKFEILSFVKKPFVAEPSRRKKESPSLIDVVKRGIEVKSIYDSDSLRDKERLQKAEYFEATGESIKVCTDLPMKMCIFDEKLIVLSLEDASPSNSSFSTLFLEHKEMAKGLRKIFVLYWNKAITLKEFKEKESLHKK